DAAMLAYDPTSQSDLLFGGDGPASPPSAGDCSSNGECGGTWLWSTTLRSSPMIQSFQATPNSVELGISTTLSVQVFGGVSPYTYSYSGLPAGCSTANVSQLNCTPTAAGTFSPSVNVVDSAGNGTEASTFLRVAPDLTIASFNATPGSIAVGGRTLLSVDPANGEPPVGYTYSGLPPGCSSQSVPTLPCSPTQNGTFTITVHATDHFGKNASASLPLSVHPAGGPTGPRVVSYGLYPNSLTLGNSTTLFLNASGGNGPLTYAYSGLPAGCATANQTPLACTPTVSGVFAITFSAIDSTGVSVAVESNLTVYPIGGGGAALITTFGASPGLVVEGNTTVVTVEASGGTAPLTFTYPSLPPGCRSANTATLPCTPTAVGTFTISVIVTDARGNSTGARTTLTVVLGSTRTGGPIGTSGSGIPIVYLEWILGGFLGLVAAVGLTDRVLARRRVRLEGEALVQALSEEAEVRAPPPR
ncbi:MAG: hypothetical protein L3K02_00880, partial [Thermoplasmata archaeon]|nr:hypothetical protein [Thermoplasmata archaeon]